MIINGEKVYLYSPYEMKRATDEEIEEECSKLIHSYNNDAVTMFELASDNEILANINALYGEVMSRLDYEYSSLKFDIDNKIDVNVVMLRNQWTNEHPNEKAPAMAYFEANARALESDEVKRQLKILSDLNRFKNAFKTMEHRMNAVKRKMDAIKYEDFGVAE